MNKKLKTSKFQADMEFEIKQGSSGFALFYTNDFSKEKMKQFGTLFGHSGDYSGFGLFVTPDDNGQWVLHGNVNQGMAISTINTSQFRPENT